MQKIVGQIENSLDNSYPTTHHIREYKPNKVFINHMHV